MMTRIAFIKILLAFLPLFSASFLYGGNQLHEVKGLLYSNGKAVSVMIDNGMIIGVAQLPSDSTVPTLYIAPGLIDLQINGYMGVDFSNRQLTPEDLRNVIRSLWKVGVTSFLPTVVPNEPAKMMNSFRLLAGILKDEKIRLSIPGLHLESPYISPVQGYRGAHLEKNIRLPDWDEFQDFQNASGNNIRIITVAPEVKGAIPFIRKCRESGLIVSLGHHNGRAEDIKAATGAGASLSTHLGNGCANMIDRHLNPIWPQLASPEITATIIVDGFHLTKEEVYCFHKIKGTGKTILVSDAVDLAGLPPGNYTRREKNLVLTPDNAVRFPDQNVLAGAASPLSAGVGNIISFTGCSLAEAIQMASTNPSRLLHLDHIGEIRHGMRADLILFRIIGHKIEIVKTYLAGEEVFSAR
jgi:N-acetylglucosamine-6-phosphate deacetylase